MPDANPTRRRTLFALALTVPVLLLLILGLFSHRLAVAGVRTSQRAQELEQAKESALQLVLAMVDNETGHRGFLLTENPEFLEPYEWSIQTVPWLFEKLDRHSSDPEVAALLRNLHASVELRLQFAAEGVQMQQSGRHAESVALVTAGQGKKLMDQVRKDEAAVEQVFTVKLQREVEQYLKVVRLSEWVSWATMAFDVLFATGLVLLLRRFQRSQQLLHVCAWSKTVEYEGEWITFEEYLRRKFSINVSHGISPREAEKVMTAAKARKVA